MKLIIEKIFMKEVRNKLGINTCNFVLHFDVRNVGSKIENS